MPSSKSILITGATDGIGLAAAKLLAADGYHLVLHGRNPGKLEAACTAVAGVSAAQAPVETDALQGKITIGDDTTMPVTSAHPMKTRWMTASAVR